MSTSLGGQGHQFRSLERTPIKTVSGKRHRETYQHRVKEKLLLSGNPNIGAFADKLWALLGHQSTAGRGNNQTDRVVREKGYSVEFNRTNGSWIEKRCPRAIAVIATDWGYVERLIEDLSRQLDDDASFFWLAMSPQRDLFLLSILFFPISLSALLAFTSFFSPRLKSRVTPPL